MTTTYRAMRLLCRALQALPLLVCATLAMAQPAPSDDAEVPPPPPPPTAAPETSDDVAPDPGDEGPADSNAVPLGVMNAWQQQQQALEEEEESSVYVDKEDNLYPDVVAAWGFWQSKSLLLNVGLVNMYYHDEGESFGFHGRFLSFGVLSFEQSRIEEDGSTSTDRETSFAFELVGIGLREHFTDWLFLSIGVDFGASFYDGFVPTTDSHLGLGFQVSGWGLESGVRTSRLPNDELVSDGEEYARMQYGAMVYVSLETNISY